MGTLPNEHPEYIDGIPLTYTKETEFLSPHLHPLTKQSGMDHQQGEGQFTIFPLHLHGESP